MNDDELSEFLMGEVPEPRGDFWGDLRGRLDEAAEDQSVGAANDVDINIVDDTDDTQVLQAEENEAEDEESGSTVIDLSAARERRNRRWGDGALWRSAAAAVVLIAGGAIAFNSLGGDDVQTAASESDGSESDGSEETAESVEGADEPDDEGPASTDDLSDPDDGEAVGSDGDTASEDPGQGDDTGVVQLPDNEPAWWTPTTQAEVRFTPSDDDTFTYAPRALALLSTGSRVSVDGVERIQIDVLGADTAWVRADQLIRLGDTTPPIQAETYAPVETGSAELQRIPGGDQELATLNASDQITSTGRRALVDGSEWIEVEFLGVGIGWVLGEQVAPTSDNQSVGQRQCLANGGDILIVDFTDVERISLTGALAVGDSISTLSGARLTDPSATLATFGMNVTAVGAAEDGGNPTVAEEWQGDASTITTAAGTVYTSVPCSDVTERVRQIDALLGQGSAADSTTEVVSGRTCYLHAGEALILDMDADTMTFTGVLAYLDSIQVFAGRVTDELQDDAIVLDVNTSAIGSAEEDGNPIVNQERWELSELRAELFFANRVYAEVNSCDDIGEQVAQLIGFNSGHPDIPN